MIQAPSTIKSLSLSAVLLFLAMTSESRAGLPAGLATLLAQRSVPPESLSVYIKQVGHSSPLVEHLAEVPRNPASTMKLVTTAAALELLGPDYRWNTGLFVDGKLKNGTLKGDLIFKGGGDPWLVMQRFWLLLRELQQRGLQRIDGDLVIDASLYDDTAIAGQTVDIYYIRASYAYSGANVAGASTFRAYSSGSATKSVGTTAAGWTVLSGSPVLYVLSADGVGKVHTSQALEIDQDLDDGVSDTAEAAAGTDSLDPNVCGDSDGDTCDDCAVGTDDFGANADNEQDEEETKKKKNRLHERTQLRKSLYRALKSRLPDYMIPSRDIHDT